MFPTLSEVEARTDSLQHRMRTCGDLPAAAGAAIQQEPQHRHGLALACPLGIEVPPTATRRPLRVYRPGEERK